MKFISCWASPVKHLHAYMQPLKIPFFYEHCLCHYHRHCLCYCHNHWHLRCNFFLISRHGHWLSLLSYCHRQCFFSATVLVIVRAVVTLLPLLLSVWLLLHFHRLCHSASMSVCLFDCLFVCLCDCQCHWSLYTVSLTVCHCHSLCQGLCVTVTSVWLFPAQSLPLLLLSHHQCHYFLNCHHHCYYLYICESHCLCPCFSSYLLPSYSHCYYFSLSPSQCHSVLF